MLFTDGSVDTKTGIGFGAYLAVKDMELPLTDLKAQVKIKQFANTSSTTLELQTFLWAIDDELLLGTEKTMRIAIYSDSQNLVGLPARRSGLEQRDYYAANGKRLSNTDLYQQFFKCVDQRNCQFFKLDGHKPQCAKSHLDRLIALVDKSSRSALREFTL